MAELTIHRNEHRSSDFAPEYTSIRKRVLIITGVMIGMLLAALDQTIVGTAMPRISAELHGLQHYAWIFTAYTLASTVTVPIYGKLSDLYGRRPFFLRGMLLFLLGSALCGMAESMLQLIVFRAIQGLGAGAMIPIAQAIIGDIFPPAERGKWQGLLLIVFGLATVLGPTLGGTITDNWGWRWVFYLNMPIGAVALAVALRVLPHQSRSSSRHIDYLGAATLIVGTIPLLLAFSWAGTVYAWRSPQILGMILFSAVLTGVFVIIEGRTPDPIISPALFRNSIFTVSAIATFLISFSMFGTVMYLPLFIQAVIGGSATLSGLILTPMMLSFMAGSIVGGQIMARTGRYKRLALGGFTIAAFGMFLLSRMGIHTTNGIAVRNMVILGLGLGVMNNLFIVAVQNAFPAAQLGQVTATLHFFRSIGGTISVALLGTLMASRFEVMLRHSLRPGLANQLPVEQLPTLMDPALLLTPEPAAALEQAVGVQGQQAADLFDHLMLPIRHSLASAITEMFAISAVVLMINIGIMLFMREIPLRRSNEEPVSTPAHADRSDVRE